MAKLFLRGFIIAALSISTKINASQNEQQLGLPQFSQNRLDIKNSKLDLPQEKIIDSNEQKNIEFLKLLKKNSQKNKNHGILHSLNQTLLERNNIRDTKK